MDSDNSWSCSSSFIYCVQGQRKEAAGSPVPALARMTSAPRLGRKIVALFQKQGLPVNWDEKGATAPAARTRRSLRGSCAALFLLTKIDFLGGVALDLYRVMQI